MINLTAYELCIWLNATRMFDDEQNHMSVDAIRWIKDKVQPQTTERFIAWWRQSHRHSKAKNELYAALRYFDSLYAGRDLSEFVHPRVLSAAIMTKLLPYITGDVTQVSGLTEIRVFQNLLSRKHKTDGKPGEITVRDAWYKVLESIKHVRKGTLPEASVNLCHYQAGRYVKKLLDSGEDVSNYSVALCSPQEKPNADSGCWHSFVMDTKRGKIVFDSMKGTLTRKGSEWHYSVPGKSESLFYLFLQPIAVLVGHV